MRLCKCAVMFHLFYNTQYVFECNTALRLGEVHDVILILFSQIYVSLYSLARMLAVQISQFQ